MIRFCDHVYYLMNLSGLKELNQVMIIWLIYNPYKPKHFRVLPQNGFQLLKHFSNKKGSNQY